MARNKSTLTAPADVPEILPEAASAIVAAQQMIHEQEAAAQAVARQIGYEGTLTIGALEDEIRFYQRRTVEAILETGKRLLVLKELTPHGEFERRVEMLGFGTRTARRFMQAAAKTAKSAILADLSKQTKNGRAFLELVTHDDDDLEDLSQIDDIDRMSASELRAAFRNMRGDNEAKDAVIKQKSDAFNKLAEKLEKRKLKDPTPDTEAAELVAVAHSAEATACAWIEGHLRQAIDAVMAHDQAHGSNHAAVMSGFIARIEDATDALRLMLALPRLKTGMDDPFEPMPDDLMEQISRKTGIPVPTPINAKGV